MKFPTQIKIGGFNYKVEYKEAEEGFDNRANGYCHRDKKRIVVNTQLGNEQAGLFLLHEICHAIFEHAAADNTEIEGKEEYIVSLMSNGLYQVLTDNQMWK